MTDVLVKNEYLEKIRERVTRAQIQQELVVEAMTEMRASLEGLRIASERPVELFDLYYERIAPGLWR